MRIDRDVQNKVTDERQHRYNSAKAEAKSHAMLYEARSPRARIDEPSSTVSGGSSRGSEDQLQAKLMVLMST